MQLQNVYSVIKVNLIIPGFSANSGDNCNYSIFYIKKAHDDETVLQYSPEYSNKQIQQ